MSEDDKKWKPRLRELRQREKLTLIDFARKYNISENTLKSYENGNRNIPIDTAISIANDFSISLDWLFRRTSALDDNDTMVDILLSLEKVFKIEIKRQTNNNSGRKYVHSELVLFIDRKFRDYLSDIQDLEYQKSISNVITDEIYNIMRKEIYLKYKAVLENIFDEVSFNEKKALEIGLVENIALLDILAPCRGKDNPPQY